LGRSISLFTGYAQQENRTTNYCLLILKMLYEENPKFLAEVLATLIGEDAGERIGVRFRQQERSSLSVPDGVILQPELRVYIETKTFDWFYDEQLERHLDELNATSPGFKVLIALGRFDDDSPQRFAKIETIAREKYQGSIAFARVSFEDLAEALRLELLPKNLADAVAEFRAYLDEQDLLPTWKHLLDVVNCAGIPDDITVGNVYLCPATGGAYRHARCKYFGMYRNKRVEKISIIEAVVDLEDETKHTVNWRNDSAEARELVSRARAVLHERRPGEYPTRVFLLGDLFDTDFRKDTPGGMLSSKQYFNVSSLNVDDAKTLAERLRGRTWTELRP
jgi:hypothetical protein